MEIFCPFNFFFLPAVDILSLKGFVSRQNSR